MKESIKKLLDQLADLLRKQEPGAADRALNEIRKEEQESKH